MTAPGIGAVRAVGGRLAADRIARNSAFIMLSTVATSALGYLFWLVVDHTSDADVSGRGATVTSALQIAALLASVGAAAAMVEWLPRETDPLVWRQRLTVGLTVAVVTGLLGSVLTVLLLGDVAHTLPELRHPTGAALFCVGAICFAVGTVLDYAAVADGRSLLMLVRNVVFNGLRTPLLFVPALTGGRPDRVLGSWAVAAAVSLVVAVVMMNRGPAAAAGRRVRPVFSMVRTHTREMAGSLVGQHLVTVAAMVVAYLLPIIVSIRLASSDAAYFFATWMLGSLFFIISPAVSTALFAEGASGRADLRAIATKAGRIIALLLAGPMVLYLLGGGVLLGFFGPAYAHHGRVLLILLVVSAVPDAVTNVAVSVLRATHRIRQALWLNVSMLVVCLVLSWLLTPSLGIVAVGLAWLLGQSVGAAWVVVSWRRIVDDAPVSPAPDVTVPTALVVAEVSGADHTR